MFRLTRLTDYGILILGNLASRSNGVQASTRELAEAVALPTTTACKILKTLARGGLLVSSRGSNGGYSLARSATNISMAEIIAALEGPHALCSKDEPLAPEYGGEPVLEMNWQLVHQTVRTALDHLTLAQMMQSSDAVRHLNSQLIAGPGGYVEKKK